MEKLKFKKEKSNNEQYKQKIKTKNEKQKMASETLITVESYAHNNDLSVCKDNPKRGRPPEKISTIKQVPHAVVHAENVSFLWKQITFQPASP